MALISGVSHLSNPLATIDQLAISASQLDGVPAELEISIRYASQRLVQSAGVVLDLPQQMISEATVVFTRFWLGAEGGSLLRYQSLDIAAAALYLVCKPSAYPVTARQVLTAFRYLQTSETHRLDSLKIEPVDPEPCFISEGSFQIERARLMQSETQILRVLGYQTHVALPHALCITYMQTLDVVTATSGHDLAKQALAHLNAALLNPQLLYLTHQPNALATAAIYLAAKEVGEKLPECEWWEVFDVNREELGFLVVSFLSMAGFADEEARIWKSRKVPMSFDDIRAEIETRQMLETGE